MHSWKTPLLVLALATAPSMGCEEEPAETPETEETEDTEAESPEPETEPEAEAEGEPAGPRVAQEGYTVELSGAEGPLRAGELTQLALVIEGQGEWHINQDFPFGVDVQVPDGVQLPKDSFGKDDAASFADEGARVDVPMTPTEAGEHRVQAEVRFAICNPESCIPKTETVALALQVE
jgi:hypothetical protein